MNLGEHLRGIKACLVGANGPAPAAPGHITGHGHRRPRLYREAIVTWSSAGFKYPGGLGGSAPHAFALIRATIRLRALRNDFLA
jgi:hypothetical protein